MHIATTFSSTLDTAAASWAGTALLWLACGLGLLSFGYLLAGALDREPEAVKPAAMLVLAGGCALYLAGRLG